MERPAVYHIIGGIVLLFNLAVGLHAEDTENKIPLTFSADAAASSKYIWRGQRLTDGWSFQPAGTFGIGNFSMNVWGNMDLAAVNEGDSLLLSENPAAPAGDYNGLQGHFSEVDYTFSYAFPLEGWGLEAGTIVYTFPERSASLPATVEIYTGVSLDSIPLAPSATVYVDVDENGGGLYFNLAGSHQIAIGNPRFPGLEFSGSLGIVNQDFGEFYYGAQESGLHDFAFSITLPINIGEHWSAGAFCTYAALLGDFRDYQYLNARDLYLGVAGSPASAADTVFGGLTLNVSF